MFKSLKEKLGKAIGVFSKKVAEESSVTLEGEAEKEKLVEEKKEEKQTKKKEKSKKTKEEKEKDKEKKEEKGGEAEKEKKVLGIFKKKHKEEAELSEKEKEEQVLHADEEKNLHKKKGLFSKGVIRVKISESKFEDLFWDIEIALLENNVAVEVIEKIKSDLKKEILDKKFNAFSLQKKIKEIFNNSLNEILSIERPDLLKEIKNKKPYVIAFIGVNGSGKTTSLAKVANMLKKKGHSIVIAACDTFRAAALQQIEEHANNLDLKLIKHDYGSDAAAVAFDAIKHAESKKIDVVLIDTAGRSHSNINLMDELKKVIRVSKPDMKIFVGDSLTGNDVVEQAKSFNEAVGIDALILSKMDIDEKGGASISVSYVTKKPILFTGTGQQYKDLEEFDKEKIIEVLGL
jgi:fused signal recognition particle receptor